MPHWFDNPILVLPIYVGLVTLAATCGPRLQDWLQGSKERSP